jgi:copper chaperone CopZ
MKHVTLHVAGMRCRRCVREVTARVRDVAGVGTVAADVRTATVRISGDMTVRDLLRAFAGTPYRPRVAEISHDTATGEAVRDVADHSHRPRAHP